MVPAVAQALKLGTDHRTDATQHTTPGRVTTLRQNDPFCASQRIDAEIPDADHIDSSLFVVSRASGKVAASPLLFSEGCYPPRSLSGVTTFAVSIGIWLMAAPEFVKGTLASTLIGPCGQVTGLSDRRQAYGPSPLVKFLHSQRGGVAGRPRHAPRARHAVSPGGMRGRARIRWTCARAPVAWFAGSCPGAWSWTGRAAAVGWVQVREWLGRRAGVRGVSRPRWRQSRSPGCPPGPAAAAARRASAFRCW